jgi:hypothetical protein
MSSGTDVFAFGLNAANAGFAGTFITQLGTYYFSGATDEVLAGTSLIRLDRGSTVYIGSGSHVYNQITIANTGNHSGPTISFEADFSNAASPVLSHMHLLENLGFGYNTNIFAHTSGPVVAPDLVLAPPN